VGTHGAEVQRDYPSGRLFMVSMATALAVQMVPNHSSVAGIGSPAESGMPRHRLRQVQSYIEVLTAVALIRLRIKEPTLSRP
jgi:hypothetical protein